MAVAILEGIRSGEFQCHFASLFLGWPDQYLEVMIELATRSSSLLLLISANSGNDRLQPSFFNQLQQFGRRSTRMFARTG
jgi:hypothetical protein